MFQQLIFTNPAVNNKVMSNQEGKKKQFSTRKTNGLVKIYQSPEAKSRKNLIREKIKPNKA